MTTRKFSYQAVVDPKDRTQVTSVIAYWTAPTSPVRAVLWHAAEKEWIYAPAIAEMYLYDDQFQELTRPVDRPTAERIARENLRTTLPSEEETRRMCEEGARLGQEWGPPRG